MRTFITAALIAASIAPASAYVRHPVAAAHYASHGGIAHPYAAYRVARGVGAAAVGAAAAGAYYSGYSEPYDSGYAQSYDTGYTQPYGTDDSSTNYYAAYSGYGYGNAGYYGGGHVVGCGIGNWRCNRGYAQPYNNYGTNYYDAAYTGYGYGDAGYYGGGHVVGCGIGNRRCW